MRKREVDAAVHSYHRMMAHAFNRELTPEEHEKFHKAQERYDEAILSLPEEKRISFIHQGDLVFKEEEALIKEAH